MRHDVFDENDLSFVINFHDQPVLVSRNIENRAAPIKISVGVNAFHFRQILPGGFARNFVPSIRSLDKKMRKGRR
jgi:hypothetical protein